MKPPTARRQAERVAHRVGRVAAYAWLAEQHRHLGELNRARRSGLAGRGLLAALNVPVRWRAVYVRAFERSVRSVLRAARDQVFDDARRVDDVAEV